MLTYAILMTGITLTTVVLTIGIFVGEVVRNRRGR